MQLRTGHGTPSPSYIVTVSEPAFKVVFAGSNRFQRLAANRTTETVSVKFIAELAHVFTCGSFPALFPTFGSVSLNKSTRRRFLG